MVRKQIYLPADEDRRIKELARSQGRSAAAWIRGATSRQLEEEDSRDAAWRGLQAVLKALPAKGAPSDRSRRSDAYGDRVDRYDIAH